MKLSGENRGLGIRVFRSVWRFTVYVCRHPFLLKELVKRQILIRYRASYLGLAWAFIEPIVLMLILNFVFGFGLRKGRDMGIPFITYLITGLIVHLFFTEALSNTTVSIWNNEYLVKKVDFRVSLIPFSQVLASLFIHILVLLAAIIVLVTKGISPIFQWLEVTYYMFSLTVLLFSLGLFTSSLAVYVMDLKNVVLIVTRFLFYLSPIFWSLDMFPERFHFILKLNPMYYIITGYRQSFFGWNHFWQRGLIGIYYWIFVILLFLFGFYTFKRLRPHFADVL